MKKVFNWIPDFPYRVILGIIPIFLLLGYLMKTHAVDIQLHDTYIVIDLWTIAVYVSGYLAVVGALYFLFRNRKLSKYLTLLHVVITILAVVIWVGTARGDYVSNPSEFEYSRKVMGVVVISVLSFLGVQILLIINLIQSLFLK